ncbi:MAG: dihydroneopterin aldolase [Bacteroidales bacterium]
MESFIELEHVKFFAYHGVMPQERIVGNNFEVNLRIRVDFKEALDSDLLDNTISYADVYEVIKKEMMIPSDLIEHVAGRILRALTATWPTIEGIELKVSKINPPIPGDVERASVILKWNKPTAGC